MLFTIEYVDNYLWETIRFTIPENILLLRGISSIQRYDSTGLYLPHGFNDICHFGNGRGFPIFMSIQKVIYTTDSSRNSLLRNLSCCPIFERKNTESIKAEVWLNYSQCSSSEKYYIESMQNTWTRNIPKKNIWLKNIWMKISKWQISSWKILCYK